MPVLTRPRHGPAATSRPSASSFRVRRRGRRTQFARCCYGRDEVIPWRMHEKDPTCSRPDPATPVGAAEDATVPAVRRPPSTCQSERGQKQAGRPEAGEAWRYESEPMRGEAEATASPRRCLERPYAARAAGLSLGGVDASTWRRVGARLSKAFRGVGCRADPATAPPIGPLGRMYMHGRPCRERTHLPHSARSRVRTAGHSYPCQGRLGQHPSRPRRCHKGLRPMYSRRRTCADRKHRPRWDRPGRRQFRGLAGAFRRLARRLGCRLHRGHLQLFTGTFSPASASELVILGNGEHPGLRGGASASTHHAACRTSPAGGYRLRRHRAR